MRRGARVNDRCSFNYAREGRKKSKFVEFSPFLGLVILYYSIACKLRRAAKILSFLTYFFQICNMNRISRFRTLLVFSPSLLKFQDRILRGCSCFYCDSVAICFLLFFSHFAFSLNPLYSDRSVFPFLAAKVLSPSR